MVKRLCPWAALGLLLLASTVCAQGVFRNQRIFVVPCPGPVTIDGDLKDWDLSGEILSNVTDATSASMNARTALMYDADALYVSCRITDSSPMMNRCDPAVNPDFGWDGDCLQLRLCLNPALGYPLKIGSFDRSASDDLVHMTFWYYTDGKLPVLHMKFGMNFHDAPDYPKGIVPHDKFQAAYKRWDDGSGYTLEYRIPWNTLHAKSPLKGGDLTAGALQVQWSNSEGTNSHGGWCVDLMSQAGFSYQSTGCWGKVIFTDHGHLPKELTQEGLPPVRALPLKFNFELPKDQVLSVVLANANGDLVRHIISAQPRQAGKLIESWDGLDDAGHVLPPGTYTWKAAYHDPFTVKYILSVDNSGEPGYPTPDGKGAWGGDWGVPQDICFAGDRALICWDTAEAGPGIIMLDKDMKKQWGGRFGATYLATDGEWLYAYLGGEKQVRAYAVADGKQLNFLRGEMWVAHNAGNETHCTGLAWSAGKLYIADAVANTIIEYDARQGTILRTLQVTDPHWLAAVNGQTLATISGGIVQKVSLADGALSPWISTHLDHPQAITLAPDGSIYVSNLGKAQNVAVYSSAGSYLRSIGKPGGRAMPATLFNTDLKNGSLALRGKWNAGGMLNPHGMAVDDRGRLWVTESDFQPKRISIWDAKSGKLLDEKFGPCYVSTPVTMDPADPTRVYCNNVEWKVDLRKGTWAPSAVMIDARKGAPYFWPHMVLDIVFTAKNGKQYMHAHTGDGYFLYVRRGDHFEAVAGLFSADHTDLLPKDDPRRHGNLLWTDLNGDGLIEPNELIPTKMRAGSPHSCFDADLNMYTAGMYGALFWDRISPGQILPNGVPVYSEATLKHVDYVTHADAPTYTSDIAVNPRDGSVLMYAGADIKYMDKSEIWPLNYWTRDGKMVWRHRNGCRWYDMYEFPVARADQYWGCTKNIGITDGITGFSSYFGMIHLLTTDGVALGTIMKDGRSADPAGADRINCEWFTGQLVKVKDGRWFLLGGDQDGRVLQVLGLDTVQRTQGTLTITPEETKAAADALVAWAANKARAQSLTIARTQDKPNWMDIHGLTIVQDEKRQFTVKAAYDAANLYLDYQVMSPYELTNSFQETQMLFKGGNALDLQLATDPNADAKRVKPAPGDLRVLITRREGKPIAIVYHYTVPGLTGQPTIFTSPTGSEQVDQIEVWDNVTLNYEKTDTGFNAMVTLPLDKLGWKPISGTTLKMDVGYLYGNETGNTVSVRSYWSNHSFNSGVTNDVPCESRIEPAQWGTASVE